MTGTSALLALSAAVFGFLAWSAEVDGRERQFNWCAGSAVVLLLLALVFN